MSLILQKQVSIDEAVVETVSTYRNGCNYAVYFHGKETGIGYGCDGVLINLQSGSKRLLHDWFKGQHSYGDKTPNGFHVPLPVSKDTILKLKSRNPCSGCGSPFFHKE